MFFSTKVFVESNCIINLDDWFISYGESFESILVIELYGRDVLYDRMSLWNWTVWSISMIDIYRYVASLESILVSDLYYMDVSCDQLAILRLSVCFFSLSFANFFFSAFNCFLVLGTGLILPFRVRCKGSARYWFLIGTVVPSESDCLQMSCGVEEISRFIDIVDGSLKLFCCIFEGNSWWSR